MGAPFEAPAQGLHPHRRGAGRDLAHRLQPRRRGRGFETAEQARSKRALVDVLPDTRLRRSGASSLTCGDVRRWDDGSGRITVVRSKTDAEA